MLEIQKYLLNHHFNDLKTEHGVTYRMSAKNPLKFSLNYDMIESKREDKIASECRGLILEAANDPWSLKTFRAIPSHQGIIQEPMIGETKVLACGFYRFFNLGEPGCAEIDWDSAVAYDKIDGTLILYYFDYTLNKWCCGTRSVPDADQNIPDSISEKSFNDLFQQAIDATYGVDFPARNLIRGWTYMFELTSPENKIVVPYRDYRVTLLGARDNTSRQEISAEYLRNTFGFKTVASLLSGSSKNHVEDFVSKMNSEGKVKHEGVVVCDKFFNRCKIKNEQYKLFHRLKDKSLRSERSLLEVILLEKDDDALPLLEGTPSADHLLRLKEQLRVWLVDMEAEWTRLWRPDISRKDFALAIQAGSGNLGPHMQRFSGRTTNFRDWVVSQKKDDSFPDAFLEGLLSMIKKERNAR